MKMRKTIILAASVLLFSCNTKENDMSVYDGEYTVDNATVITMNGNQVSIPDYSGAAIRIAVTAGNDCDITLINLITGQTEVDIPGTLSSTAEGSDGTVFSGETVSGDRSVTVEGTTSGTTLASVNITEKINVQGIPGKWTLGSISLEFSHPDMNTLDLSGLVPGASVPVSDLVSSVNERLNSLISANPSIKENYVELTEDGYVNTGDAVNGTDSPEDIISYYIRQGDKTLNIHLPKSVVEAIFLILLEDPESEAIIEAFELGSLISNPQSIVIPFDYNIENDILSVTADQEIVSPYLSSLSGAIDRIKEAILLLPADYSKIIAELIMPESGQLINDTNYTVINNLLIDIIDALISPDATYSVTFGLTAVEI